MTTHTGLTLDVYRPANGSDCTCNGITSTHARVTLVGTIDAIDGRFSPSPESARVFEPTDTAPPVALRSRGSTTHLVPVDAHGHLLDGRWYMAGGNYANCSDSRVADYFHQLGLERFYGAISVHDRHEG